MSALIVAGAGACAALGLNAQELGFLTRVGFPGLREAPLCDAEGSAPTMGLVPTLPNALTGVERLLALATLAAEDLWQQLGAPPPGARVRLFCLTEEPLVGEEPSVDALATQRADLDALAQGLDDLAHRLGGASCRCELFPLGAGGAGHVLRQLTEALQQGSCDIALLLGVHTDCVDARLRALSRQLRVYSSDNRDALLLGEGCGLCAFTTPAGAQRWAVRPLAHVAAYATGHERARPDNDESAFEARGVTAAVRAVAQQLEDPRFGWLMSDLNMESFRTYELQALIARTQGLFCEPQAYAFPAQRLGHWGAAALPLHIALAVQAFSRGYAPFPRLLSVTGSDSGARTAVVVTGAAPLA